MKVRCTLRVRMLLQIIFNNMQLEVSTQDPDYNGDVEMEFDTIYNEVVDVIKVEMDNLEGEAINEYRMTFLTQLLLILGGKRLKTTGEIRRFGRYNFWDILGDAGDLFTRWINLGSLSMMSTVELLAKNDLYDFDFKQSIEMDLPYLKRWEFKDVTALSQLEILKSNFSEFNSTLVSKSLLGVLAGLSVEDGPSVNDENIYGADSGRKRGRPENNDMEEDGEGEKEDDENDGVIRIRYKWNIIPNVRFMTLSSTPQFFDFLSFYSFRDIWRRNKSHTFVFDPSGNTPNSCLNREFKLVKSINESNISQFCLKDEIPNCVFLECQQVVKKSIAGSMRSIVKALVIDPSKITDECAFVHYKSRHIEYVPLVYCDNGCINLKLTDLYGRELRGDALPYVRNVIEKENKLKPGQSSVPVTVVQLNILRRM